MRREGTGPAPDGKLDRLIRATGVDQPEERLSGAARARILDAIRGQDAPRSTLPPLFVPARRLLAASALPVMLAGALLLLLFPGRPADPVAGTLRVAKQGDRILLTVVGGGGQGHTVYRSTAPDRFDASLGLRLGDGTFEDRLIDATDLVFYRID